MNANDIEKMAGRLCRVRSRTINNTHHGSEVFRTLHRVRADYYYLVAIESLLDRRRYHLHYSHINVLSPLEELVYSL